MTGTRVMLVALIGTLTVAGTAAGYVAGRIVTVGRGDRADFRPSAGAWSCFNRAAYVSCASGDARPYVDLTTIACRKVRKPCGIAVKVHILRDPQGGTMTRTLDIHGDPVYVFTAF